MNTYDRRAERAETVLNIYNQRAERAETVMYSLESASVASRDGDEYIRSASGAS